MSIIIHASMNSTFSKVDRYVATLAGISDGAKVLYLYIVGLKRGDNFSDNYLLKALDISKVTLSRRKKELANIGLLLSYQIAPRQYILFVGNTKKSAEMVKQDWYAEQDNVSDKGVA